MTLHQLKIWTTIARCLSITKAAGELRIKQPSVTQQIRRLEKEYRVKLYNVNGRGNMPKRFYRMSIILRGM